MSIISSKAISNSIILLTQEPLSDRLKTASLNTLLGMGIVFAVLTLIILIISLFKFLPGSIPKEKNQEPSVKVSPVDNVIAQIISQEEANLINNNELVAVITAAICNLNSENLTDTSAGGFVVRSIRKINNIRYY
jgi:sodium pump decarboxylase gamma subunit